MQQFNEGWVTFLRFKCLDGNYLDVYSGDSADNPNNSRRSNFQVNGFSVWIRTENKKWVKTFSRSTMSFEEYCKNFPADEIYEIAHLI